MSLWTRGLQVVTPRLPFRMRPMGRGAINKSYPLRPLKSAAASSRADEIMNADLRVHPLVQERAEESFKGRFARAGTPSLSSRLRNRLLLFRGLPSWFDVGFRR